MKPSEQMGIASDVSSSHLLEFLQKAKTEDNGNGKCGRISTRIVCTDNVYFPNQFVLLKHYAGW